MIAIAAREVPVASRSSKPSQRTRSGTMIPPPPTPKRPLKAAARMAMTRRRETVLLGMGGHTTARARAPGRDPRPGPLAPHRVARASRALLRRGRHAGAHRGAAGGRARAGADVAAPGRTGAPLRRGGVHLGPPPAR